MTLAAAGVGVFFWGDLENPQLHPTRAQLTRLLSISSMQRPKTWSGEACPAACFPTVNVSVILEGETMRFKCLDSKALILRRGKELVTSLVSAAVLTAAGFAIGSAS